MNVWETIRRPTAVLDAVKARRHVTEFVERARHLGVRPRPHFKTHQSAAIGAWFRDAGVEAITVSSLDMARYFHDAGWRDLLVAIPVNPRERDMLVELAGAARMGVVVDGEDGVAFLRQGVPQRVRLDVHLEIDVGGARSGVPWNDGASLGALAAAVAGEKHLRLAGILTHSGHTYACRGAEAVRLVHERSLERLRRARDVVASAAGASDALSVSVGDTPAFRVAPAFPGVDEVRPGNFVFLDLQQVRIGVCTLEDLALAIACPVIAVRPERREAVIYGGAVHLSRDTTELDGHAVHGLVALPDAHGWRIPERPLPVRAVSQEHGLVELPPDGAASLRVGDVVAVLPAHACLAADLHPAYRTLEGETLLKRRSNDPAPRETSRAIP